MKFSILLALALSYTTLSSAQGQNFRPANADKAEQLTKEFAKLTKDSPCENNAQACVEDQFAQCVGGKFQLNSCGGGELKCVVLPLVNKPGTSITCSTEADRLARLADARGGKAPENGKNGQDGKVPKNGKDGKDGKAPKNGKDGKDGKAPKNGDDLKAPDNGDGGKAPENGKDGKLPPDDNLCKCPPSNNDGGNGKENDNKDGGNGDGKAPENGDGKAPKNGKDGKGGKAPKNGDGKKAPENGKDGKLPPDDKLCKCPPSNNDGGNGKENDNKDGGNGDGKAPSDNDKLKTPPANGDGNNNQDNLKTPPANGDGNLADIRKQNAADAKALQKKFDALKPDDKCNDNDVACVDNKFAQCSGGKFALSDCASGTICAALPLVLKKGTTVACTTEADRDARLKQSETNTK
ncbi:carbohydrate-binding module family 19 protein [Rhizophagus irregularis DAOM 181602=DAOM 197198]|nr:carbohydrate-binding module family 19 protein [Rhizophagus irregularis DAOM 181602=DAOM 197198]